MLRTPKRTGLSLATLNALLALTLATTACSGSGTVDRVTPASSATSAAADIAEGAKVDAEAAIRDGMAKLLPPGLQVEGIAPGPLPGLTEVTVDGRIAYVTSDGAHFVQGPIIELGTMRNLTQHSEAVLHKQVLAQVGPDRRIIFPATGEERYKVTVFTDVECSYCQAFHKHIGDYNAAGITVEYLMFPRGGVDSTAGRTMRNVWCADDRQQALTDAKLGKPVLEKDCDTPIAEDYELGRRVGLAGTPAIFSEDGLQVGGYLVPEQLLTSLERAAQQVD